MGPTRPRGREIVYDQIPGHAGGERLRSLQAGDHVLQLLTVGRPDETVA